MRKNIFAFAVLLCITAGMAFGAIDWNNPSFSMALTKAEIETISGLSFAGATYFSCSFIKDSSGKLLLIQDPSGATGTGLLVIDLAAKTGSVRVSDATLNPFCDEASTPVDQDTTGLCLDTRDDTVYMIDREDDDEMIKMTSAGVASIVTGVTGGTIGNSGVVFADTGIVTPDYSLIYVNTDTDAVVKYNIAGATESTLVDNAAWIAVTGGSGNGIAAGPVLVGDNIYIFDEAGFTGSDAVIQTNIKTGATSIYTAASVFGGTGFVGFSTMVVTSDGTVIGWDEYGPSPDFVIVPNGTGTPIHISRATIATALGVVDTEIDPSDENSMLVWIDTASSVEVLFGVSGPTTGGCVGKMTFPQVSAVADWNLY
jgi:hypothetical protein